MKSYDIQNFKILPWRNGGGLTCELYRFPETGDFDIRLSLATVERAGPFSLYPGVNRWLLPLTGEGFELRVQGKILYLRPGDEVWEFSGDDEVFCQLLDGPVTDFNVMIKRGAGKVIVKAWDSREHHRCDGDELFLYFPEDKKLYHLIGGETLEASTPRISVERYRSE